MDQSLKFVVSKISAKANSILTLSPQAKAWGYSAKAWGYSAKAWGYSAKAWGYSDEAGGFSTLRI